MKYKKSGESKHTMNLHVNILIICRIRVRNNNNKLTFFSKDGFIFSTRIPILIAALKILLQKPQDISPFLIPQRNIW